VRNLAAPSMQAAVRRQLLLSAEINKTK
jgi:hypothetical protein